MAIGTTTPQQLGDQLLELARGGDVAKVEEAWMAQLGSIPTQPSFVKEWLKSMKRIHAEAKAEELVTLVLEDRAESGKWKPAMRMLLAVLPAFAASAGLRQPMLRVLAGFYQDVPMLDELLEQTGLKASAPLIEGYKALTEWVKVTPGQVYQHYDWGLGVIQELDLATNKVTLAFPKDPQKVMTVDGVRKFLKYIEPGHFLARKTKEPETLLKLADADPAALIKDALASQEGQQIKQADLKSLLTDGLIEAGDWNSWWGRAREALKLDPFIDFDTTGGARAVIKLRDKPRTFEQEIEESFFAGDATVSIKAELIRQLARHSKENPLPEALLARMANQLQTDWRLTNPDQLVARLEIAYMASDLNSISPASGAPRLNASEILEGLTDYSALFEVDSVDYGIRALVTLLERDGEDGCSRAADLLPRAPVKMAQSIWKALDQEHHIDYAVRALQKLLDNPLDNVETYAWAVRAILDGTWEHLSDYFPISGLVPELLDELDRWQRMTGEGRKDQAALAKSLLSKVRTLLSADKFEAFGRAAQQMGRDQVQRMRRQIQSHGALPEAFKMQADRNITLTRKDLDDPSLPAAGGVPQQPDLLLCTNKAYNDKAAELREISSVKIPKNSRVIEEARMEGDLRENAGYQYAKEEQKMLVQQQATLTEQLSNSKIVYSRDVDASRIGFGTFFRARNEKTGQDETYTVLGRWEADAERHVLSQQAPLAQQFTGKQVGEKIVIQHPGGGSTPYEILEIGNALASGEWDA